MVPVQQLSRSPVEAAMAKERGFSFLEVMIASAVFLIVAVGLLPLFAHSVSNNLGGREATDVANLGRSRVEELFQLTYNHPSLTVPAGQTVLVTNSYFSKKDSIWKTGTETTTDPASWTRVTRVRQYSISDLQGDFTFNNPLDGSAPLGQVHIKEIEVEVVPGRDNRQLGPTKQLTLRMLKAD
jgi:prepilin-type N-terminal cleavage/methylation domain-containing protein